MLFGLARQLGLDSDGLHEVVAARVGKESLRQLSRAEATGAIEHLLKCLSRQKRRERHRAKLPANVIALATRKQLDLIEALAGKLGYAEEPERFKGLVRRITGRETVRTSKEAQAVIEGLKAMQERARKKAAQAGNT